MITVSSPNKFKTILSEMRAVAGGLARRFASESRGLVLLLG